MDYSSQLMLVLLLTVRMYMYSRSLHMFLVLSLFTYRGVVTVNLYTVVPLTEATLM